LKVDYDVVIKAREILQQLKNTILNYHSFSPATVAAISLYLASKEVGKPLTQEGIAKQCKIVSEFAIREVISKLKRMK
jgi:transcription initiation factor TFIIIB Brf1 subunit/transcription initiation factor TFIIB